jgi:hypothetical protein
MRPPELSGAASSAHKSQPSAHRGNFVQNEEHTVAVERLLFFYTLVQGLKRLQIRFWIEGVRGWRG